MSTKPLKSYYAVRYQLLILNLIHTGTAGRRESLKMLKIRILKCHLANAKIGA